MVGEAGDWQRHASPWGDVWLVRLEKRPLRYLPPFGVAAHSLLLWDATFAEPRFPNEEMSRLAEDIVAAACAYSGSGGFNASAWDDLIDWVHVMVDGAPERWPVETLTVWFDGAFDLDPMAEGVDLFAR